MTIICREERFSILKDTMAAIGVTGMTVSNVMGVRHPAGQGGAVQGRQNEHEPAS